jgi:hypothetical protein
LEHRGILDEGLGNAISRVVRRSVELVLGVRVVIIRDRRVTLLRALAGSRLRLRGRLCSRRVLLG